MTEKEAYAYIESVQGRGIVPGLNSIQKLCEKIGNPQDNLQFVHIAGTNGKGSTLAYISTILKCAAYKVGRYISPTIFTYRERIQVNERPISKVDLGRGMELVKEACDSMVAEGMPQPTAFEIETALAFWYFCEKECDIVVLETGMGGLTDATNIVKHTKVAVLTSIGMDHMQFLGNTITDIATQKAGIIKEGAAVVCLEQEDTVQQVIRQAASRVGAPVRIAEYSAAKAVKYGLEKQQFAYREWKKLTIHLAGQFQIANAVLALEAVIALQEQGFRISDKAIYEGLEKTTWKGRFTVVGKKPLFIVDGAHNEDAATKLAKSIEYYFTNRRIIYIMGMLKDKECEKVIALTHAFADQIITITPPDNPRGMHSYELATEIAKVHPNVTAVDSLEEAVEMSHLLAQKEDVIIAFGSLSYLGRLMTLLEKNTH